MGPLGWQEIAFIFLLALVLFGPKKLPELARMVGKAMSEFRRAQSEMKATFEREMRNLEQENESLKGITNSYRYDNYNYNYDYSSSDAGAYGEPYGSYPNESQNATVIDTSTAGASATEGAGSVSPVMPEGAIAHEPPAASAAPGGENAPQASPAGDGSVAVEHNA